MFIYKLRIPVLQHYKKKYQQQNNDNTYTRHPSIHIEIDNLSSADLTVSKLYIISSSQTLPNHLSNVSTRQCISSKIDNSFSSSSTPTKKNSDAYLLYTTFTPLCSMKLHCFSNRVKHRRTISASNRRRSSDDIEGSVYLATRVWPCLLTISTNLIVIWAIFPISSTNSNLCLLSTIRYHYIQASFHTEIVLFRVSMPTLSTTIRSSQIQFVYFIDSPPLRVSSSLFYFFFVSM